MAKKWISLICVWVMVVTIFLMPLTVRTVGAQSDSGNEAVQEEKPADRKCRSDSGTFRGVDGGSDGDGDFWEG